MTANNSAVEVSDEAVTNILLAALERIEKVKPISAAVNVLTDEEWHSNEIADLKVGAGLQPSYADDELDAVDEQAVSVA